MLACAAKIFDILHPRPVAGTSSLAQITLMLAQIFILSAKIFANKLTSNVTNNMP